MHACIAYNQIKSMVSTLFAVGALQIAQNKAVGLKWAGRHFARWEFGDFLADLGHADCGLSQLE